MIPAPSPAAPPTPRLNRAQLFTLFAGISLVGFGGVMPWMHRVLVERRRLLSAPDFAETLAYAQLLPGPTVCNLAIIIGHRHAGMVGAVATLAGMVLPPFAFVLLLAHLRGLFADSAALDDALRGMAVAAAALVAATALRLAKSLPPTPRNLVFAAAMFAGIALLHWPLILVMLGLGLIAFLSLPKEA